MVGGYVIIPIRGENGEKINVTATSVTLKAGTYNKIVRAMKLRKRVVLEDVIINNFNTTPLTCNYVDSSYSGNKNMILALVHQKSTDGSTENANFYIYSNDTIRTSSNFS